MLVPIKEMTDVLSVESKAIDLSRDTWVRMKIGTYKGDLAKVILVLSVSSDISLNLSLFDASSFRFFRWWMLIMCGRGLL